MTHLEIPDFSLVLLIGPSGAGKSTFAARHFAETEIVSSDRMRAVVCDDENNQAVTPQAFALVHQVVEYRLRARRLTVVDATNLLPESRRPLLALAKRYHCPVTAIVWLLPLRTLQQRRRRRRDRDIPAEAVREHARLAAGLRRNLKHEGLRRIFTIDSPDAARAARIVRRDPWADMRADRGPFDLIGDVHGCYVELEALLAQLGYHLTAQQGRLSLTHPEGRKPVFVGDLVDRGPNAPGVMRLVMDTVEAGQAYCAPGNHDIKLARMVRGHKVTLRHGLEVTAAQLAREPTDLGPRFEQFCGRLLSHLILDEGRLVVAHAGIREHFIGRESKRIWAFTLYGDVTGQNDADGFPIRGNWAADYHGEATVVYGHTPVRECQWENKTINIDTGCVFGGRLTALRYPEQTFSSVRAAKNFYPETLHVPDEAAERHADNPTT